MITPRLIALCIYPLLLLASAMVVYQCRELAKAYPSKAWRFKKRLMWVFGVWQIFGVGQAYAFAKPTWWGVISFSGTLVFVLGLSRFDYLLLDTAKRLRERAGRFSGQFPALHAGQMTPEYWQERFDKLESKIDKMAREAQV